MAKKVTSLPQLKALAQRVSTLVGQVAQAATDAVEEQATQLASTSTTLSSHTSNKKNPHGVTAAQAGALAKATYDPRNKAQDVFAYADGMAQAFVQTLNRTAWKNSRQTISNSLISTSGYIYFIFPYTSETSMDVFLKAGIYADAPTTAGTMTIHAQNMDYVNKYPSVSVCILAIKTGGSFSSVHNCMDLGQPLPAGEITVIGTISGKTVPAGRMTGDINGDGKIDQIDLDLCKRIINGTYSPTSSEKDRADINRDQSVGDYDLMMIESYTEDLVLLGTFSRDLLGSWDTYGYYGQGGPQFYTDVAVSGIQDGQDIAVALAGDEREKIVKVETLAGRIRFYSVFPPVKPIPFTVL